MYSRNTIRPLVLLAVLLPTVSFAQEAVPFFPYQVGDQWAYEVEGIRVENDVRTTTVDGRVEWTVRDVRHTAERDTIWFDVARRNADGSSQAAECVVLRTWLPGWAKVSSHPNADDPLTLDLCRSGGGFPVPLESNALLRNEEALGAREVTLGADRVQRNGVAWTGRYEYACFRTCGTGASYWEGTIRSTLLAGIGQVEMTTDSRYDRGCQPAPGGGVDCDATRRDTTWAQLVGAVVDGERYGDVRPVASEPAPDGAPLALQVGPNPSRTTATVWVPRGSATLTLLDALGRVVTRLDGIAVGPVRLDVSGLPGGAYTVRVEGRGASGTARLMVVR